MCDTVLACLFQLYYTPGHLNTFIGMNYTDKIDPNKHEGLKASVLETVMQ